MSVNECVVCGLPISLGPKLGDYELVICLRCGTYSVSGTLAEDGLPEATAEEKAALSAAIRSANERKQEVKLLSSNWRQIATPFFGLAIPQKLRLLLEYIGRKSGGRGGADVTIKGEVDYPVCAAADAGEYHFIRQALFAQGLTKERGPDNLMLSLEGWETYRPGKGGTPGTCFVAMAFDKELDPVYDVGIEPAVRANKFTIIRVDRVEHNENINDKIIADIRACQFMVADFTRHKSGVYFEAGFALGLGRQVIWTCQREDFKNAHFDTRPYSHVVWDKPDDLRDKLDARIRATIGV